MRALALALALVLLGCGPPPAPSAALPCPHGHARDPAREGRVIERLRSVALGAELLSVWPRTEGVCFAPDAANVVTQTHLLLVSSTLSDGEAAARVGHLLVHVRDGLPLGDDGDEPCEERVRRALRREARAHVTEVRLQHSLHLTPQVFAFEFASQIEAMSDERAIALVDAYLQAHPDGAPGIDALGAGYRQRCDSRF